MNKKKLFFALSTLGIFTMCGVSAISFKTPLMAKGTANNYTVVFDKSTAEIQDNNIITHTSLGNEVVAEATSLDPTASPNSLTCLSSGGSMTIWVQQLVSISVVYNEPNTLMADISDDGHTEDQLIFDMESGETYFAEAASYYYVILGNMEDVGMEITSITITYACA